MRKKISELYYRSSRICRVLGNPTAYEVLKALSRTAMKPTDIAKEMRLSIPTISAVLRSLRQLDLVRYETVVNGKMYSIKDTAILSVMSQTETLVKRLKTVEY
jgi:DNA-binding transcriptional ArsR family regulator